MSTSTPSAQAVRLILHHFRKVKDPRVARTRRHELGNVLVMALCAALCGADGFKAMALFARSRARFLRRFLSLPHGTPSADTFRRVFGAICPQAFEAAFRGWVAALAQSVKGQVVAMDGKAVRGAIEAAGALPLHLLHVWASEQRLVLAQQVVPGAPGEVKALPELIAALQLEGAVVTTDANGCCEQVAQACVEKKADYVLALKGNRGPLHALVRTFFILQHWQGQLPQSPKRTQRQQAHAHGRQEVREVWAVSLSRWGLDFPGLRSAVLVRRERQLPGKPLEVKWHTYLSSLPAHAPRLARTIRQHWGVENGLHWVLDVGFSEDRRRVRHATAAANLSRTHRLALTLLQRETTARLGIALKRQQAAWDEAYLLRVLSTGLS
jgi:predicted transposase YbfD/YdcC